MNIDPFDTDLWAEMDEYTCPCDGIGWANRDGVWKECPIHYIGQLHPDERELLWEEPKKMKEEERKSLLKWKIDESKNKIVELQSELKKEQANLLKLELDLINRTPTSHMMPAVIAPLISEMKE